MHIIVKNGTRHFQPHYNRTMGKYYDTSREYYSDLKSKGLEPYDPSTVRKQKNKKYVPSQWARDIVHQVQSTGHVSGNVKKQLADTQMKRVPKELKEKVMGTKIPERKGGWF